MSDQRPDVPHMHSCPAVLSSEAAQMGAATTQGAQCAHTSAGRAHSVHLRWTAGGVVVEVKGEVDLACRPPMEHIGQLLASWDQPPVVDVNAVTFIDVAGLRALSALAAAGQSVLVLSPSSCFLRLLRLLALSGRGPAVRSMGPQGQGLLLLAGADAARRPDGTRSSDPWC